MTNPDSLTTEHFQQAAKDIISNLQDAYNLLLPNGEIGNIPFAGEGKDSTHALRKRIEQLEKQMILTSQSAILHEGEAGDVQLLIEQLENELKERDDNIDLEVKRKIEDALREINKVMLKK